MPKYEKHDVDEGRYQCPLCDYGHGEGNGKSRQAITSHWNKVHKESEKSASTPTLEGENVEIRESTKPQWLNFDMSGEDEKVETISISPLAQSFIKGLSKEGRNPQTPKELKQYYEHQVKMLTWFFTGIIDPLFIWYGRTITTNANFDIKRSASDIQLMEESSTQWLEYRQIDLPVTPDIIMAVTVGSMYLPVVRKIHKNRDPNRPSFIKRWRQRRALRKALKQERMNNA